MALKVDDEQVIAFRLAGHHLSERLPLERFEEAAGACAIVNAVALSAATAVWARVADVEASDVEQALVDSKRLIQTWSLRGTPHVFPTREMPVFTHALVPPDEAALRFLIRGAGPLLDQVGITAQALADYAEHGVRLALDQRTIVSKKRLDSVISRAIREQLPGSCHAAWDLPSPFAANQTVGEALSSFAFRQLGMRGTVCFAGRSGNQPMFARTDQWLTVMPPTLPFTASAALLVKKYLRCYGPSTLAHFGQWVGLQPQHAQRLWNTVIEDLEYVDFAGVSTWIHRDESAALQNSSSPAGVRLLPPLDPWVQLRDHSTILSASALQRRVWRAQGWPATVIHRGRIIATWRSSTNQDRLYLHIDTLEPLTPLLRAMIEAETLNLARFKGQTGVAISYQE